MLELKDFLHLPRLDPLFTRIVEGSGLVVVAGLDARPQAGAAGFLPSGRATIFRILLRQMLEGKPDFRAIVVAEDREAVRVPRQLARQVRFADVGGRRRYPECIADAARTRPNVLVIDRLTDETAPLALECGRGGLRVLSQLETVFTGAAVARHLHDLGAARELLDGLAWVVAVQRLELLCTSCKRLDTPDPARLADLQARFPAVPLDGPLYRAGRCARCHDTGRKGDVAAFDVFHAEPGGGELLDQPSVLPLEEYVLELAAQGHLSLDDATRLGEHQLHRMYSLLAMQDQALSEANASLRAKVMELEAANRVLQQRTEALISLQDIGHALSVSTRLPDLASRVCRHARDLCGADRSILYLAQPDGTAEVIAVSGWDARLLRQRVDAAEVMDPAAGAEPARFDGWPAGVPPRHPDVEGAVLRAGLRVPLVAESETVGVMHVHATRKAAFTQGEVALLQAFADQAAVAIQRTGLIETLREKVAALEAAQAELVTKERLERELELARQVQQSMLPRVFPLAPGYAFAARAEPARQVGGDFYDVILLDADRFGVVVADVSDKGMPAALYMALARSLLMAEARRERSPRAVLANVHRLLRELAEPSMFVTMFYGVVDGATRRLTYARAGHDRPLVARGGSVQQLGGEGTFLGYFDEVFSLTEEQLDLMAGDRLVVYSDGLIDAFSADGQPFGLGRLAALLEERGNLPAEALCDAVFAAVAAHQGAAQQYDDMTLLVVAVE